MADAGAPLCISRAEGTRMIEKPTPMSGPQGTDAEMLEGLQRETFDFFIGEANAQNGLFPDKTQPGSPASVAGVGLGLSAYIAAVERGFISRPEAIRRTLRVLEFFRQSPQGVEPDATGYKGFYYHFLDMENGRRAWKCELSTIDTAIFIAGVLTVANYFTQDSTEEERIREISDFLYRRIDWPWALNGGMSLSHGWSPEGGFLPYRWDQGYSEAMIMYVLALGSPTFPISEVGYRDWVKTFEWVKVYDYEYIYAGPLFIHQMSHLWLDFRGIYDECNRQTGIDYFENSRRATYVHRQYAIENPRNFVAYGENCWGFTASDGPGPVTRTVKKVRRKFYDYIARGAPYGPDDGTVSPWAVVASLPFAPEIVLCTIRHAIEKLQLKDQRVYGFDASFNPTFREKTPNQKGWVSPWRFALNQGPIVMMIENYHSGLIWKTMHKSPYIAKGLQRAGFRPEPAQSRGKG
jgi:hypothetical protein